MVGEALYGTLEAKRETTLSARMHGHLIKVVFLGFGAVKSGKRMFIAYNFFRPSIMINFQGGM